MKDPKALKRWDEWSEKTQTSLIRTVVAIAERWHWTRYDILSLPTRQRALYLELYEEIVDKEREASRARR